jgi:hypothetical protein
MQGRRDSRTKQLPTHGRSFGLVVSTDGVSADDPKGVSGLHGHAPAKGIRRKVQFCYITHVGPARDAVQGEGDPRTNQLARRRSDAVPGARLNAPTHALARRAPENKLLAACTAHTSPPFSSPRLPVCQRPAALRRPGPAGQPSGSLPASVHAHDSLLAAERFRRRVPETARRDAVAVQGDACPK